MPARLGEGNLVARPDRVDFRDRLYQPPLRSLPDQYPAAGDIKKYLRQYVDDGNILDQGKEGACTGFGLAAVVNYVYWARWMMDQRQGPQPFRVSPHMLYRNARVYDEWEGEDYEGSSCRGAMKGWFKHGICDETLWPSIRKRPDANWAFDAAARPLGAYYRVDAKSIADMQAAIYEVQAVYCSADVHDNWGDPQKTTQVGEYDLKIIDPKAKVSGGHAFAIVGYTNGGFIVQNSWNTDWGTSGFALLTYEDWVKNGYDAWVAALGAPMRTGIMQGVPSSGRGPSMIAAVAAPAVMAQSTAKAEPAIEPWTETEAYEHAIVMGNDGKLLQRLVHAESPADALKIVALEKVKDQGLGQIAVYVHGGLNSEDAAIKRVRRMGPWFEANGIHPLFVIWRTGIMEAIGQIGLDEVKTFEEQVTRIRAKGFGDIVNQVIAKAREAFDRAFEAAAEKFIGKAVWSQMKQNAAMAAAGEAGMVKLVETLAGHDVPIHLLGHSAGSIMLGHMLDAAAGPLGGKGFATCGLYAPACTLDFAAEHYGPALQAGGVLANGALHIDILSDEAEAADTVGPYGSSLLYLVSRALEDMHKMPLLGLDIALRSSGKGDEMELNEPAHRKAYKAWKAAIKGHPAVSVSKHAGPKIEIGPKETATIAHGTFDNDLKVVNDSLKRMLGGGPLEFPVTDLSGY